MSQNVQVNELLLPVCVYVSTLLRAHLVTARLNRPLGQEQRACTVHAIIISFERKLAHESDGTIHRSASQLRGFYLPLLSVTQLSVALILIVICACHH